MSLTFFEGFEHYSSYTDISGILNMPCNMSDDSRTIKPIFSSGVEGIQAKNSGTMLVMESSHQAGNATNGQYLAFYPSVAFDLQENLTEGIVGFAYKPVLPNGGTFGDGDLSFTPIACLTDEDYKPHLFICMTSNGQVQIRKYIGSSSYTAIGSAKVVNNVQTYPSFLLSTSNSTIPIGSGNTHLPLIAESPVTKNRLYLDYWNYLELKFSFDPDSAILRINRNETSTRDDIKLEETDTDIFVEVLAGTPSGSGTAESPMFTTSNANKAAFKALVPGTAYLRGDPSFSSDSSVSVGWYKNGIKFNGYSSETGDDATYSVPVVSGDTLGVYYSYGGGIMSIHSLYIDQGNLLTNQTNKHVRHLVLGTFWGHKVGNLSPAADLHWKTLVDDIYCINTSGNTAPSGFLGTVSCRRIPYDEEVVNTSASGGLVSVSEPFAGSGSFKLPEGSGAVFFDDVNQEFFIRSSGFDADNEEIIAVQTTFNAYALNSDDYIGIGLEVANGSGTIDFAETTLSTDSINGSVQRGAIYTTDPSGNAWTEDSVRNTTFKLKSFSNSEELE